MGEKLQQVVLGAGSWESGRAVEGVSVGDLGSRRGRRGLAIKAEPEAAAEREPLARSLDMVESLQDSVQIDGGTLFRRASQSLL